MSDQQPSPAQDVDVVRLLRQAQDISHILAEAGCGAMPIVEGVRWLVNKNLELRQPSPAVPLVGEEKKETWVERQIRSARKSVEQLPDWLKPKPVGEEDDPYDDVIRFADSVKPYGPYMMADAVDRALAQTRQQHAEQLAHAMFDADERDALIARAEAAESREAALRAELEQARRTADYWKSEHLAGNALIETLKQEKAQLEGRIANALL